jgi:hypothetical protein
MMGFWGQITTLKLIHICCRSIQGHNIIRCKAFSNTIHNFCVGNITKQKKIAQDGDSNTSLCLHKTSRFYFMQIWHSCQINGFFFYLLNENTIFYYIKTKQSCYYLIFFMKVFTLFTFVSMLAYTFRCQCPNNFNLAIARLTREIVHQYVVYRNEDLRPLLI